MISVSVMAHPSRLDLAEPLVSRFDATLALDQGAGEWSTGRRALLAYDPRAEWHCVVQDDAIVPPGFASHLERVTAAAEGHPLGLYVGKVRPRWRLVEKAVASAERAGAVWIQAGGPWWGVAVAFPTALIPAIVDRGDEVRSPFYDTRLARAVKSMGLWCRYPLPSLVDHDPGIPSLLDHAGGDRRAHRFIGDRDPDAIDWTGPVLEVDRIGRFTVPASP